MKKATIMLTGDLMCMPNQQIAAMSESGGFDFKSSFKYVKNIFNEADFRIGNLETLISSTLPLSMNIRKIKGKPFLNSPPEFLEALKWVGYDALILANNHATDGKKLGVEETFNKVNEYGFLNTGSFPSKSIPRYILTDINGIKVGFLGYATYYNQSLRFNPFIRRRYMMNRPHEKNLTKDIRALKGLGAEYIIAYNHCGTELVQEPSDRERFFVQRIAEAGVDFVVNSHPHVLQPFEYVITSKGKKVPVMFSMGNFSTAMKKPITRETLVLKLVLEKDEGGQVNLTSKSYMPCFVLKEFKGAPYVIMPQSKRYNESFYSKKIPQHFKHIKEIVGVEDFDKF